MLKVGDKAPDFALVDQAGNIQRLSDQLGSWVVVYFYPKDDTPGCTTEACQFRDALPHFEGVGAKVFGISADDQESHLAFARKYDLNFPLLVDPELTTLKAYGAYGDKGKDGVVKMGVFRRSYLVDPSGRVARAWDDVVPEGHAEEIRNAIQELKAAA
ncbi:MAG TPA: peroxiredoxin [Trueperaceae bacterium]|nr:peroxiredoxin [Trueperaceae bacterium]